jgi:hypothetical protein
MKNSVKPGPPRTLMQAHEELVRARPCRKASLPAWLAYHQHSVDLYEQIAKTDPGHDGEALYWAQRSESTPEESRPVSGLWERASRGRHGMRPEEKQPVRKVRCGW